MLLGAAVRLLQSPRGRIDPASQFVPIGFVLHPPSVLVASAGNLFLFASSFFQCWGSGIGPRLRNLKSAKI